MAHRHMGILVSCMKNETMKFVGKWRELGNKLRGPRCQTSIHVLLFVDSNSKPWDGGDKTSDARKKEKNQDGRRDGALGRGTAGPSCSEEGKGQCRLELTREGGRRRNT